MLICWKSLDIILNSRIISYEKRKLYNDNYDVFLKKITYNYIDSVFGSATQKEQEKLIDLKSVFINNPERADKIMRDAFYVRNQDSLGYLDALFK